MQYLIECRDKNAPGAPKELYNRVALESCFGEATWDEVKKNEVEKQYRYHLESRFVKMSEVKGPRSVKVAT